ncbi:uncharacterized protein [Choristoneura fumiferana]|uniref:uncharacterized protein n=1 Tax=Choristoneura fumiferana TaxID=7141 RepID=UPI003D15972C
MDVKEVRFSWARCEELSAAAGAPAHELQQTQSELGAHREFLSQKLAALASSRRAWTLPPRAPPPQGTLPTTSTPRAWSPWSRRCARCWRTSTTWSASARPRASPWRPRCGTAPPPARRLGRAEDGPPARPRPPAQGLRRQPGQR